MATRSVRAGGVTGISLTATGNGTNLLSSPINSASQFTDHSINLGALGTSGTLDVVLTLTVDTKAAGAGFFADFLLGDPRTANSFSALSLHPSSAVHTHTAGDGNARGGHDAWGIGAAWEGSFGHGPGPGW
jgi:hypothetical protein